MRGILLPIATATVLATGAAHLAAFWVGVTPPDLIHIYTILSLAFLGAVGALALIGYIGWLALWEKEPHPAHRVTGAVRRYVNRRFLAERIAPLVLTFAFLGSFSSLKVLIPSLNPFGWDSAFAAIDRMLFGTEPMRLTHALIGPAGTRFIDWAYGLWLPAFGVAVLFFSVAARREMQRRFFLSFIATWALLGLGFATLFSSVGPCFLDLIGHPDAKQFEGLFPIDNAPGALRAQIYLADGYSAGGFGFGRGISAMPSVHVAVAALYVLAARHYGPWAFAAAALFYGLTMVGSVHLGWHYAVDGIAGTVGAAVLWRLTRSRATQAAGSSALQPHTTAACPTSAK